MTTEPFPVQAHLHADAYAQSVDMEIANIEHAINIFNDRITHLRQSVAGVRKAVHPVAGMPMLPVLDNETPAEEVSRIARMFAPRSPAQHEAEAA